MAPKELTTALNWHPYQPPYRAGKQEASYRSSHYLHGIKDHTDIAAHLNYAPGSFLIE